MDITVVISAEGLFNGWDQKDLDQCDTDASATKYAAQLERAIRKAFPQAQVEVEASWNALSDNIRVWYPLDDEKGWAQEEGDRSYISEIIGLEYQNDAWYVGKTVESA